MLDNAVSNFLISAVRTGVPMIVGWLFALPTVPAVLSGLGIDTERATQILSPLLGFALAYGWWLLARWLESKWPSLGWLIGKPAKPLYAPANATVVATPTADGQAVSITTAPAT